MSESLRENPFTKDLTERLAAEEGLEAKLDAIREFKKEQLAPLKEKFFKQKISLPLLMDTLSHLADAIMMAAYGMAKAQLRLSLGDPQFLDPQGNLFPGEFAIIGMGKLGGRELNFDSDLDVIFIYNRNGDTNGPKVVTNREYFAKLTQRIINYLTLHTTHGYAYHVDTELRPSGMAGALVTPIDSWTHYYDEMGQIWERQALLKARLIYASGDFSKEFQGLFEQLIFLKPFPEKFGEEIHRLRLRMEKELAKESNHRWNFKKGYGGLVDIEFLVQYLQLKWGKPHPEILTPNTLVVLEKLLQGKLLSSEPIKLCKAAYEFYRQIEFHMALQPEWNENYLNPQGTAAKALAGKLGYKNRRDFINQFAYYRENIRKIFLETLGIEEHTHDL